MNNIPTEENTDRQLQRLAAQRQLYSTAKQVFGAQIILGGPIALLSALLGIVSPSMKGWVALWGIAVTLCDLFWLTAWQERLRDRAARIQEAFDCDVLSLPWNELKAGLPPDPELIKEQSEKYKTWAAKMPSLSNWYGPEVGSLPLHIARLVCQRSNCRWDAEQRRRYANWVIVAVVMIFISVLCFAMSKGLTIEGFVLQVADPLLPVFLIGIRHFREQHEAAARLEKIKECIGRIWTAALAGQPEQEVTQKSRELQDEILDGRKRNPLVFDRIYRRLQRDFEVQMNHGIADMVSEAKKGLA